MKVFSHVGFILGVTLSLMTACAVPPQLDTDNDIQRLVSKAVSPSTDTFITDTIFPTPKPIPSASASSLLVNTQGDLEVVARNIQAQNVCVGVIVECIFASPTPVPTASLTFPSPSPSPYSNSGSSGGSSGGSLPTPPDEPSPTTNVSGTSENYSASIAWSLSAGATYYKVYREGQFYRQVNAGLETTDTNLSLPFYDYSVAACNASSCSSISAAVRADRPLAISMTSVYRFRRESPLQYFYTVDPAGEGASFVPEGNVFNLFASDTSNHTPLYRCWSENTGHFYTLQESCDDLVGSRYEDTLGYLAKTQVEGTLPFYRLKAETAGTYFYTAIEEKKDTAISQGWLLDSVMGYVEVPSNAEPDSFFPVVEPMNLARGRSVTVSTNGKEDALDGDGNPVQNGIYPQAITDGELNYVNGRFADSPNVIGWTNITYDELLEITVVIPLSQMSQINTIRYNPGNVQRASTWIPDRIETPCGTMVPNPGIDGPNSSSAGQGVWTNIDCDYTADQVSIVLKKTRTHYASDWLAIGEIEVNGHVLEDDV